MVSEKLAERIKNDEEAQELRRRVIEITGRMGDASFVLGKDTFESWKERLKKIVEENEASTEGNCS